MTQELLPEDLLHGQREVLAKIASGAPLRETLGEIARYSEVCTPTMLASILWYEPSSGTLRRGGHASLPDRFADAVDGLRPGPVAGSCGTAAYLRARVVSRDVQEDPLWEAFRAFAAEHGIRSAWSTPLLSPSDGSLLGVFGMYYPVTSEPSDQDLRLVDHFTHLATIAIERQRRDEALRDSERTRHRYLQSLVAGLAHELNTPLGVARTAEAMLEEELAAVPQAERERIADPAQLIRSNLVRAVDTVRAFRSAIIDEQLEPSADTDVGEAVRATLLSLRPILEARALGVEVQVDGGPWIARLAPVHLAAVVTNLVQNAAVHAYGPGGGPLTIAIRRSALNPGHVELVFSDRGRGMDEETARRCTEPFFTTARVSGSSGLGLFVARHIAEVNLGGRLFLETKGGEGVRWTLELPLAALAGVGAEG